MKGVSMKLNNNFYVYIYLDPRKSGKYVYGQYQFDNEPFYVGKGNDGRYKIHLTEAYNYKDKNTDRRKNNQKSNIIRKIKHELNQNPIIVKYKENLTEREAFDLEIDMINIIGRTDLKTGPLTNKTAGGDGTSGYKYTKKDCLKIKLTHARCDGKHNSRAKKWKIISPKNKKYLLYGNLKSFCKNYNLSWGVLFRNKNKIVRYTKENTDILRNTLGWKLKEIK
jgi:hypothetical protein